MRPRPGPCCSPTAGLTVCVSRSRGGGTMATAANISAGRSVQTAGGPRLGHRRPRRQRHPWAAGDAEIAAIEPVEGGAA
jgi:hypothetical protein